MLANHNFCDREASTESIRYRRGKPPAGQWRNGDSRDWARYSTNAALISGIHFPVKPS